MVRLIWLLGLIAGLAVGAALAVGIAGTERQPHVAVSDATTA